MAAIEALVMVSGHRWPHSRPAVRKNRTARAWQPGRYAAAHQGVPAGMEIDLVNAVTGRIMGSEFRHGAIGNPRQILGFRRGHEFTHRFEIDAKRPWHVSRDVLQQGI